MENKLKNNTSLIEAIKNGKEFTFDKFKGIVHDLYPAFALSLTQIHSICDFLYVPVILDEHGEIIENISNGNLHFLNGEVKRRKSLIAFREMNNYLETEMIQSAEIYLKNLIKAVNESRNKQYTFEENGAYVILDTSVSQSYYGNSVDSVFEIKSDLTDTLSNFELYSVIIPETTSNSNQYFKIVKVKDLNKESKELSHFKVKSFLEDGTEDTINGPLYLLNESSLEAEHVSSDYNIDTVNAFLLEVDLNDVIDDILRKEMGENPSLLTRVSEQTDSRLLNSHFFFKEVMKLAKGKIADLTLKPNKNSDSGFLEEYKESLVPDTTFLSFNEETNTAMYLVVTSNHATSSITEKEGMLANYSILGDYKVDMGNIGIKYLCIPFRLATTNVLGRSSFLHDAPVMMAVSNLLAKCGGITLKDESVSELMRLVPNDVSYYFTIGNNGYLDEVEFYLGQKKYFKPDLFDTNTHQNGLVFYYPNNRSLACVNYRTEYDTYSRNELISGYCSFPASDVVGDKYQEGETFTYWSPVNGINQLKTKINKLIVLDGKKPDNLSNEEYLEYVYPEYRFAVDGNLTEKEAKDLFVKMYLKDALFVDLGFNEDDEILVKAIDVINSEFITSKLKFIKLARTVRSDDNIYRSLRNTGLIAFQDTPKRA